MHAKPVEVFPLWHVAKETGRTIEDLHELCDNERIIDCEWRKTPTGGVWWCPLHPVILGPDGRIPASAPADIVGMLPAWAVAKRDGVKPDALQRMCSKGTVPGARKIGGYWYIPAGVVVMPPRRGRRSPLERFPEWLTQPTNGS